MKTLLCRRPLILAVAGLFYLSLGLLCFGNTQVARFPWLPFSTGMVEMGGSGDDVLVFPVHGDTPVWQLRYDGWEWNVVAENDFQEWFGELPIYYGSTFPYGEDLLVVTENQYNPVKVHILRKVSGIYEKADEIGFDFIAMEPGVFSLLNTGMYYLDDMFIVKLVVGTTGEGEGKRAFPIMKRGGDWVLGMPLPAGVFEGWPVLSEMDGENPVIWVIESLNPGAGPPFLYSLNEYSLMEEEWRKLSEFPFENFEAWYPGYKVNAIPSPDGSSVLLYGTVFKHSPPDPYSDIAEDKVPFMELRRDEGGWTYFGPVADGDIDFTNLYIQSHGPGYALMRRGDIWSTDGEAHRYHLLRHDQGRWQLVGDQVIHRPLTTDFFREIFYLPGGTTLTVFDTGLVSPVGRTARGYSAQSLEPVLIKWFRGSETVGPGVEWLQGLGEFEPIFSPGGWGIWIWYPSFGWIFATERDGTGFWFWNEPYGWLHFSGDSFDREEGHNWLYGGNQSDFVWSVPDSRNPHLFYSTVTGEWMSDAPAPSLTSDAAAEIAHQMALQLEQEGVQVEMDFPNRIVCFTSVGESEGVLVTVTIHAPFIYTTDPGYRCQARFEMDLEYMTVTPEGQDPVWVSSTYMWEQNQIRLPNYLWMDFIFHTLNSGVILTTTGYNDGSTEGPVREAM
jgi:hypothetical protein